MTEEHILELVDDLEAIGQLEEAVQVLRRGQRWLQGRQDQAEWDEVDEDREYNPAAASKNEDGTEEPATDDAEESLPGGNPMEPTFRHRLAVLRLKLGDDEEAMVSSPTTCGDR
jgi:general transcription factor 3C polypeptide 3 (transcription factor C subunit 4)